jgi:steroid delta-isomerase-like uncharacterized protein
VSTEDNKALARRVIERIINTGDVSAVDEVIATDYVYSSPGMPDVRGPEGMKEFVGMYRAAFPDVRLTVDQQIAEGDSVLTRWTATGTHLGEFMGMAPTGKQVTVNGMILSRFADGKLIDDYEIMDVFGLVQQLGGMPAADAAPVGA